MLRFKNYIVTFFCITILLPDGFGQENSIDSLLAKINRSSESKRSIMETYKSLSGLYAAKEDYIDALEMHKAYIAIRDSVLSDENKLLITEMETKYETTKKDKELIKKNSEITLQNAKNKRRSTERNMFIGGFILMILLTLFVFKSYRQKHKANKEILKQKQIIEEKQKEILDSIYYARRIQRALVTNEKYIQKNLTRLVNEKG